MTGFNRDHACEEPQASDPREFVLWADHTWTGVGEESDEIENASLNVVPKGTRENTEQPDQYEDSRITNAVVDALNHYERIGLDPHPLIVGGRVVDILRGRTPPVRDTEREPER